MNIRYKQVKGWVTLKEMVRFTAEDVWDIEAEDTLVAEHYIYVINHDDLPLCYSPAVLGFRFEAFSECSMRMAYVAPWMATTPLHGELWGDEREWSYCPKEITRKRRYGLNVRQPIEDYEIEDAIYMAMESMQDGHGNEPAWTPEMVIEMLESIGISEADDAWYNMEEVESD